MQNNKSNAVDIAVSRLRVPTASVNQENGPSEKLVLYTNHHAG